MKVLFIHADSMEYELKEKTKSFEEVEDRKKPHKFKDLLVCFITVEERDEENPNRIVQRASKEVRDVAGKVKANRILVYPYAHLSSSLASPKKAIDILKGLEQELKDDFEVHRAPFGWYKAFDIKCKGHPLSELSKEIKAEGKVEGKTKGKVEEEVSKAVEAEKKAVSSWFIIDISGKMFPLSLEGGSVMGYDFANNGGLKDFTHYEMAKSRVAGKEPPHVELMQRLELVDYESGSDPGNFRYYPKGRLMKSLLERYVTEKVKETGGMEIETPIMYDFDHPSLKSYMHRFPARQYSIQTPDKKVFLRFAACFGQFLMMHDAVISYRNLPMRVYELTRYSFRVEQRGELAGLRRLRAFTMPDCHSFCADIEMAKGEVMDRFELSRQIIGGVGFNVPDELELAMRMTKDFYEENKDFVAGMVKRWNKPTLVEMWSERFFYYVFKYEWNFVDALSKASALNTDQIDVENAERYGITYAGADGEKHFPLILHQSPSGAIERLIYALLEKQFLRQQKGGKPEFPLWLAPTQVRFIPLSPDFTEDCVKLAKSLDARVDIDDRGDTVSRRIRDAEREWISMIVVYGEKEKASDKLPVRMRDGKTVEMTMDELSARIKEAIAGYPRDTLALPMLISKRAVFRG